MSIPDPTEKDFYEIDLEAEYEQAERDLVDWPAAAAFDMALIRRCAAAERERDQLRAANAELSQEVEALRLCHTTAPYERAPVTVEDWEQIGNEMLQRGLLREVKDEDHQ